MAASKSLRLGLVVLSLVAVAACSSKKKTEDQAGADTSAGQAIDSTPMSFDVAGSDSGNIAGLYTINFDYDKSALTADAKSKLKQNADWIKSNGSLTVQIEGHCDSRGTIEYNLALGERRAQAVRSYLIGLGVPAGRLNIISYGEEKLIARGETDADHAKNRRANFVPISQ